jgi:hypothetical protein
MKNKITLLLIFLIYCTLTSYSQDKRPKIKDYLNKEIIIKDNWAGQSITLIKEKNKYLILRKIFGSGVPVAGSFKYEVEFNSDYQIAFPKENVQDPKNPGDHKGEVFLLCSEDSGLSLYLNGLEIVILIK